jgi:hypothetical protein
MKLCMFTARNEENCDVEPPGEDLKAYVIAADSPSFVEEQHS